MEHVDILKGETESREIILAHKDLATLFTSDYPSSVNVEVKGSHDGSYFGSIVLHEGPPRMTFLLHGPYTARVFDPDTFLGVQYIKFVLEEPAEIPIRFWIHYRIP